MKGFNLFLLLMAQQSSPGKVDDFAGVNARGYQSMGFSHEKTTHHFHLLANGGAIEMQSNEPTDAASQGGYPSAFGDDRSKFSQVDFAIPMFIHATVSPGVETMKRLKSKIAYEAENTVGRAQLRTTTHDAGGTCCYPQLFSASRSTIIRRETPSKYKSRTMMSGLTCNTNGAPIVLE
jgi:hypothetical protein